MLRQAARLAQRPLAARAYTMHVPRVASVGPTSAAEHAAADAFGGAVAFNEDIAIERFYEKAIAADSMRAAADHAETRVLPSASCIYQNINVVHGR